MKFIKIYAFVLILCYVFAFFGGWMLFDFRNRYFVAIAACAFIIAIYISNLISQVEKMEELEKRIKKLEDKSNSVF